MILLESTSRSIISFFHCKLAPPTCLICGNSKLTIDEEEPTASSGPVRVRVTYPPSELCAQLGGLQHPRSNLQQIIRQGRSVEQSNVGLSCRSLRCRNVRKSSSSLTVSITLLPYDGAKSDLLALPGSVRVVYSIFLDDIENPIVLLGRGFERSLPERHVIKQVFCLMQSALLFTHYKESLTVMTVPSFAAAGLGSADTPGLGETKTPSAYWAL